MDEKLSPEGDTRVGGDEQQSGEDGAPGSIADLKKARRNWVSLLCMVFVLTGCTIAGLVGWMWEGVPGFSAIRPDPFTSRPTFFEFVLYPRPHPALQSMPYVPAGIRGTLVHRPKGSTAWTNIPVFPRLSSSASSGIDWSGQPLLSGGAGGTMLNPIASAYAQEKVLPEQRLNQVAPQESKPDAPGGQSGDNAQQDVSPATPDAPTETGFDDGQSTEQQFIGDEPLSGELPLRVESRPAVGRSEDEGTTAPRVLDASCNDNQGCWQVGEAGMVARSTDGGSTWSVYSSADEPKVPLLSVVPAPQSEGAYAVNALGEIVELRIDDQETRTDAVVLTLSQSPESGLIAGYDSGLLSVGKWSGSSIRVNEPAENRVVTLLTDEPDVESPLVLERGGDSLRLSPVSLSQPYARFGFFGQAPFSEGRLNINGVFTELLAQKAWAVGDGGALIRISLSESGEVDSLALIDIPTRANLRNLRFARPANGGADPQEGWLSSGWFDGNNEGDRPVVLQTLDGGDSWQRLSYKHWPAPFVFVTGFLALFAGQRTHQYRQRYRFLLEVVSQQSRVFGAEATSDKPIGWDDEDALGLKPIARALSRFIRNRDTEPPVTFGITGAWGTGKSSLMRLVADELRFYGTQPVMFNAWHHQTETHLLAALLEAIKNQGVPHWWTFSGLLFRGHLLVRRSLVDAKTLVAVLFVAAVAWLLIWLFQSNAEAGPKGHESPGFVKMLTKMSLDEFLVGGLVASGPFGAFLFALYSALRQLKVITVRPASLMARLSSRAGVGQFEQQLGFRHRFASEFDLVCRAARATGAPGIVIFVDDLDRCRPENVLVVLEAVNFLVSSGACFVIIGIDEEKVVQSVAHGFKESILVRPEQKNGSDSGELKPSSREVFRFAEHYLEKLINIAVPIPVADADVTGAMLGAESQPETEGRQDSEPESRVYSPWPRRLQRWRRQGLDVLLGVLTLGIVLAGVVNWGNDNLQRVLSEAQENNAEQVTDGVADTVAGAVNPTPDSAETFAPALESNAPAVGPTQLDGGPDWFSFLGLALVVIVLLQLLIGKFTGGFAEAEEDRPELRFSLYEWLPLIHLRHPTPRSVKRFKNQTRFLATLLRGDEGRMTLIERLFARLGFRSRDQQMVVPGLEERKLVALQALYDFKRDLFEWNGKLGNWPLLANPKSVQEALSKEVVAAADQGAMLFSSVSELEQKDVEAFLALRPSVTTVLGLIEGSPGDSARRGGDDGDEAGNAGRKTDQKN